MHPDEILSSIFLNVFYFADRILHFDWRAQNRIQLDVDVSFSFPLPFCFVLVVVVSFSFSFFLVLGSGRTLPAWTETADSVSSAHTRSANSSWVNVHCLVGHRQLDASRSVEIRGSSGYAFRSFDRYVSCPADLEGRKKHTIFFSLFLSFRYLSLSLSLSFIGQFHLMAFWYRKSKRPAHLGPS